MLNFKLFFFLFLKKNTVFQDSHLKKPYIFFYFLFSKLYVNILNCYLLLKKHFIHIKFIKFFICRQIHLF